MSKQQSAEETLRTHAATLGCSMRDLRQLVLTTFIEDENFAKRQMEALQHQVNFKQMQLVDSEISVKGMELFLLQRKLNRIMKRVQRWNKIKSFFKSKKHADSTGVKQN